MNFIGNISGSIMKLVLGMIISIYLLKDKEFFLPPLEKDAAPDASDEGKRRCDGNPVRYQ